MIRLLILMCLPAALFAQSDFIVTMKADTLKGTVRILNYDHIDRVQVAVGNKKEILTALQVLTVSMGGKTYKPVQYQNRVMLMQQLQGGYLSLYAFRIANQASYDGRFFQRLDGKTLEVPNLAFKRIMANFLDDCVAVTDKIKSGDLDRKEIEQIVIEYNACVQKAQPVVTDLVLAIIELRKKVQPENFDHKTEVLEMLADIEQKAGRNETIPNYLMDGLKSYLAPVATAQKELETVVQLAKH